MNDGVETTALPRYVRGGADRAVKVVNQAGNVVASIPVGFNVYSLALTPAGRLAVGGNPGWCVSVGLAF